MLVVLPSLMVLRREYVLSCFLRGVSLLDCPFDNSRLQPCFMTGQMWSFPNESFLSGIPISRFLCQGSFLLSLVRLNKLDQTIYGQFHKRTIINFSHSSVFGSLISYRIGTIGWQILIDSWKICKPNLYFMATFPLPRHKQKSFRCPTGHKMSNSGTPWS